MTQEQNAEELMELVEARIEQFQQELAEGKQVDLGGFEKRVHVLCEVINALPKEEAKHFEPRLKQVSVDLNAIAKVLTEYREAVKQELNRLEKKQRAQTAYHKAGSIKNPSEDKKE